MIKLTKVQKDNIIGIVIGTVMVIGGLWYFGVQPMYGRISAAKAATEDSRKKLHDSEDLMRKGEDIAETLRLDSAKLAKLEGGLVPDRDSYAWLINLMNTFIQSRSGINI